MAIFERACAAVRGGSVFSILDEGSSDTLANNEDQDEISGSALFANKIKTIFMDTNIILTGNPLKYTLE